MGPATYSLQSPQFNIGDSYQIPNKIIITYPCNKYELVHKCGEVESLVAYIGIWGRPECALLHLVDIQRIQEI